MKMEVAKNEENFVQEKKRKKGQTCLPENKNDIVDKGNLVKVKKEKKKVKKADVIVIDVEEPCDEKVEKKKKKKTKIESLDDGSGVENGNASEVSKKKKKMKQQLETTQSHSVKEQVELKQKKNNKVKNKSVQVKPEITVEKEGEDEIPKKVKKKTHVLVVSTEESEKQIKKKKKKNVDANGAIDGKRVAKNKKAPEMKVAENEVKLETPGEETGEDEEVKVKKKKKDKSTKSEIVVVDEGEKELKKKIKEKGKKECGSKVSLDVVKIEETEPKKKKRKKGKSKGDEEELLVLKCEKGEEPNSETVTAIGDTAGKKRKRKKSTTTMETQTETVRFKSGVKKKIKKEVENQDESPQMDVVFLSEKTGNTDEVSINQERRQTLQMEIDKASQPLKQDKPTGLGQWHTAQFDSSDRQQKFLRLMGGFKKGSCLSVGKSGGGNMALGKEAQQQLQQGLLGEFERAQSRRMDFSNRGSGLGFTPPSNKKFSIDINSCRSVKFDD